jgi:hypothetical protein
MKQCERCSAEATVSLHTGFGVETLCVPCQEAVRKDGQEVRGMNNETCITVSYGRVKGVAKQYRYVQACEYRTGTLQDGTVVWKLVGTCGIARRSDRLAELDAREVARERDCRFLAGIRHNAKVELEEPVSTE